MPISFFVPGVAKPGGSKKGFYNKKSGRVTITEDCKASKEWKAAVALFAQQNYSGAPLRGPLRLNIVFHMRRPNSHFGTGRNEGRLKPSAPEYCTTRPDRTKLTRSTEDALTGILWRDDAQVVDGNISKVYSCRPGAEITVESIAE